jgi:hypothetical protein
MLPPMSGNDGSKTLLYIGIGALAAVGAGYLVWRYGLSEDQKQRARQAMVEAAQATKELTMTALQRGRNEAEEAVQSARSMVRAGRGGNSGRSE